LVTPAKNEIKTIEATIKSVVCQSIIPEKWVIVSDSSTDGTDEIIKGYEKRYNFIKYCRRESNDVRHFGSKAYTFSYGYKNIGSIEYEFIGNLDADVTFDKCYFEKLFLKYDEDETLGIAGGLIHELQDNSYKKLGYNLNSVAGAVQLFRRRCFEEIGGYIPLRYGGIDAIAEVISRMKGWKVKTFEDIGVYHHRKIGTDTNTGIYKAKFKIGLRDYYIGSHPVFFILKMIKRMKYDPIIIGSLLMLSGYITACIKKEKNDLPEEVFIYARKEQIDRIKKHIIFKYEYITKIFR
jgi:glycosyltransferase involved in cell wall biosynthesis